MCEEEDKEVTSLEKLVNLYKEYNKPKLELIHLVCASCKKWLSPPIYLVETGGHICMNCKERSTAVCLHDTSLESLLNNGKYPCKFSEYGCNVFDKDIEEHEEKCKYDRHCFCGQQITSNKDMQKHIKEKHPMEIVELSKPKAELTLSEDQLDSINDVTYHLEIGQTQLIVQIQPNITNNQISVSIYNVGNICDTFPFSCKVTHNQIVHTQNGNVYDDFTLPAPIILGIPKLNETDKSTLTLTLYFGNYEIFELFEEKFLNIQNEYECPVCFEFLGDSCYQCSTGHNICAKCKTMITICPTCRDKMNDQKFIVKHLGKSHFQTMCSNADNGCFFNGPMSKLLEHKKTCMFQLITCEECQNKYKSPVEFHDHMIADHNALLFIDVFGQSIIAKDIYICYDGSVLRWESTTWQYSEELVQYSWQLHIICAAHPSRQNYSYKLEVTPNIMFHKTTLKSKIIAILPIHSIDNCIYLTFQNRN